MGLRFSIIVPTRNRPALLDRCLAAMGDLEYDRGLFEVLVVDDGSHPAPTEVLARHESLLPLRHFRTEGVGPASARNLALRHATGEYAVFTDDDCRPHPQWLKAYDAAIVRFPTTGFGGRILDAPENGICGRTSQMLVSFLYQYSGRANALDFFCSNNFSFPRQALMNLGGFDESFPLAAAEDRYICARWLTQGRLEFVADAVVEHRQNLNFWSFLRQHYRYGRGAFQFWVRRQAEGFPGNRIEPGAFYGGMVAYPFGRVSPLRALAMSILIVVSQASLVLGYFMEKLRYRSRQAHPSMAGR